MLEYLNKHFSPKCGENLGWQSWLTGDAYSVNTLVSIILLKIKCQELSKLIFAGVLLCFIYFIFVTKQKKFHQIKKQIENHHTIKELW